MNKRSLWKSIAVLRPGGAKVALRLRACLALAAITAAAAAAGACADLAMEADRIPSAISLAPFDSLVTSGDVVRIRVTVEDQDGNVMDGPPSWAQPVWSLSDSGSVTVERNGSATALRGGYVSLTAKLAGLEAWTRLRINPASVTLSAPTIYLTQAAQNVEGDVPLVAGRRALLRVFMTGHETSFYKPSVRATFYHDDREVHAVAMDARGLLLPMRVEEHRLDRSFNAPVPGWVLQPGVEMVVELDPDGVVPSAPGSQLRVPATGRTRLDVRELPLLEQTIIPVLVASAPNRQIFNWTRGMTADSRHMQPARALLPIGDMEVRVHDTYTTRAHLTTEAGWSAFLREITTMWALEGRRGYYYGAVVLPSGSAWGGLGWIGTPVSVGRPTAGTFAHELGHNMGLLHAPCGGAGGPDANYPYDGGGIGIWGYDFEGGKLVDPAQYKDFMGYCRSNWVSDYHFNRAMGHRLGEASRSRRDTEAMPEKTLLLWGGVQDGRPMLEPAFLVDAKPSLPEVNGPYRLEGIASDGRRAFQFSFEMGMVDHGDGRFGQFVFSVPYDPARDGLLERVVLSGPGGEAAMEASGASPMAVVRNRADGQVRAIVRDWAGSLDRAGDLALLAQDVEVLVSYGLPGGGR